MAKWPKSLGGKNCAPTPGLRILHKDSTRAAVASLQPQPYFDTKVAAALIDSIEYLESKTQHSLKSKQRYFFRDREKVLYIDGTNVNTSSFLVYLSLCKTLCLDIKIKTTTLLKTLLYCCCLVEITCLLIFSSYPRYFIFISSSKLIDKEK